MKRTTRKALTNLFFFVVAILVVTYLNRDPPADSHKSYSWTTVRYVSPVKRKVAALGVCHGLEGASDKPALVVARMSSDDTTWLDALRSKYQTCVYTADAPDSDPTTLRTPANRGNEAMAYLTFLIDNYDSIPAAGAVFVHGARWAWHNDHPEYDNLDLLKNLDLRRATEQHGYHNLKCDWAMSTCNPKDAAPQNSLETRMRARIEPYNTRVVSDAALPGALERIFGVDVTYEDGRRSKKLGRKDAVRAQCCAQFVVSRQAIHRHTLEEYVALREWLLDGMDTNKATKNPASAPIDDKVAGRILSYVWHILFMQPAEGNTSIDLGFLNQAACPSAKECYCKLYGKCDLKSCTTPGKCRGMYRVPAGYKVPQQMQKPMMESENEADREREM